MGTGTMNKDRSKQIIAFRRRKLPGQITVFSILAAMLMTTSSAQAEESTQVELRPDIDISVPRIQIRQPLAQPKLNIYEALPARLFFNVSAEPSMRLETNPYQAPRGTEPFTEAT